MKKFNFKTLLLAIGLVVASVQPALAKRIFFTAGEWNASTPTIFAHTWGSSDSDVKMTCTKNDLYYAEIPDGNSKVIFVRNKTNTSTIAWSGDNFWNQTDTYDIPNDGNDMFTIDGWSYGSWSKSAMGFEQSNNGVKIWYNPGNNTKEINHGRDGVSATDIGTVTDLYLKEYFVQLYQNAENLNGTTTLHYWVYRTSAGRAGLTATTHNGGWGDWGSFGDDKYRKPKFGNKSLNDNLLSGLSSGKYTFEYYFSANGHNGEIIYCNNTSAQNFKVTFSIAPPVPTGFSASVANSGGGSGQTTNNPFIIYYNQNVTLTVSASASSDSNEKLQFSFDNGSTWVDADANNKATTTIKSSATTNSTAKAIKYRYYNTVDNLGGNQGSTNVYYRSAEYTITLDKNEGTADGHCRVKYGATKIVDWNNNSDLDATKTGYKLTSSKNYTLSSASESTVMLSSHSGTFPANTTYTDADGKWKEASNNAKLYAQWTAQDYVVTLDYNNGSGTTATKNVTYDDDKNLTQVTSNPLPTKTGQDFTGYWTNTDGTGSQLVGSDGYFLDNVSGYIKTGRLWGYANDLTIYAGWANHAYTITYKDQGDIKFSGDWGATVHPTTHTYNTATTLVDAPDKTGYTFGGWFTSSNCEGAAITELGATAYTTDITLYAKWNPTTTTITLYRNDGTDVTTTHVATYDGAASAITDLTDAVRTRTGYSHDGIYAAAIGGSYIIKYNNGWIYNSTTSEYATSTQWKYTGTTLGLYSHWSANKYILTLNDDGGTGGSGTTQVTFDAKPANVNVPTKVVSEIAQIFTGYYYNDIQIFNNSGAIVMNAGGGIYTDNSGNWKYDGELTLTAKWEAPAKQKVYFGVTNGTEEDETSGTVSAIIKSTSVAINSGDEIDAGTVITISFSANNGQYISNNGWKLDSWYDGENITSAQKLADAGNKVSLDYTIPTQQSYVYAYAPEVTNTFAIVVNSEQTRMGSVDPAQGTAGPNVMQQITATPNDGYSFVNWTQTSDKFVFVSPSTNESATANVALKNNADQTITANFKINEYTITYNNVDPSEHTNPANYTIETATITLSDASRENYTFDGWFDAETEGNKVTEITLGSFGDKTLWARWHETLHNVNIVRGTGIESVSPAGATNVGNVTPVQISATVKAGYTWKNWTTDNSSHVTFANANANPTTITATGGTNVYANATEILLPLTTSANESYMGSVEETASSIGVATSSQLTAKSANRNYKFKQWHLTNCTITSGTVNNATITVKGDGVNNPSAEAEFEVAWLISGNTDISTGWDVSGVKMTVVSDGVFKFEFNATKVASDNGDYNFKVYNTTRTAYYANEEGGSGWWFTRGANSTTLAEGAQSSTNMSLRSDMVGNYIFTLDCSTSRENPTLTVTFPTTTTYNVDIYYDGVTKTTVEGGAFAKQITAQVPESMQFDHWEVEGETTHVNITDVNSQTTTFTASGEGAVIRAKFKVVGVMYLKADGGVFGDAYVNFYSTDGYWSGDKGSGNKGSNCMSRNRQMTKIGKTDIYYFDVSGGIPNWTWSQAFSFVNKSVEHDNFSMCNVVYRSDYNDRLPLYVPRYGYITHYFIECHYYNDGIWMKYNDTYSGYKLWIKEKNAQDATAQDVTLNALTPGGYEFNTKLNLKSGTTYELKIHNENGEWYGVSNQTITATSCTNWHFWKGNNNCQLTTSEAGDYTFVLNLGSGEVIISVEYPLSASDYQVVAKQGETVKWVGDLIKNSGSVAKNDTTSFFNNNYTYQLQQYQQNGSWSDVGSAVSVTDKDAQVGVITLIVTQDGSNQATLAYEGVYTGNYYIRTDGVDGGWGDYKNNSDNKMDNYGSLIDADPDYKYDVYKAKWVPSGKNVKFRIANDYSKAISDELKGDDVIGTDKETLPQEANVRFMWNSKTNQLKRAYLSGSSNPSDRYLILEGDAKMFDKDGEPLKITGLNDNELNFEDKNNWVYQADIQAQPGCAVKLTAKYNGKVQYFIGKEGTGADSRRKIIDGSGTDKYNLRAVYDFKTNRLVVGWMPSDTIKSSIELGSDMLIERVGQDDASQIVFGGESAANLSISKIQHIYGVLKLTKESMLEATATTYDKCIYWISFPFDVKVSEIFGVEKYGEVWAISNYRGDLRAQKGWFKQDTQTFWEFLQPSDIMKANVGYTLNLDPDYFNKESSEPWKASATEVAWYFPSIKENVGVVSLAQKDTTLEPMRCTIDREFNAGTDDAPRMVNHKFTDSNWRVIGVPAFQNLQSPTFNPVPSDDETGFGLKGFYEWNPEYNTYTVQSTDKYTFHATHSYMVQYEGKITWSNAAVITSNKAPWHAPEYTYADAKNYSIKLEFGNDDYTDQTFVTLIEKASTDFVLNEDMMKLDNAGFPNIYSFAGAYNVAYNETTFDNQTVMLGVSAPKNGSYTFAMPKDFSGKAVLVDLESGDATDLNLSNYTVELNKGTYNNRFQLLLEVEAKIPTAIDNAKGEWSADGKTKKLLINDQIYLINAGRVYNATGTMVR